MRRLGPALSTLLATAAVACARPGAEPAGSVPPRLPADEVTRVVADGDPFGDRDAWVAAASPEVRFVEYTRSAPVEGLDALDGYLQRSGKARGPLKRAALRVLVAGDERAVFTRIADRNGAVVGASLWWVQLGDGLVREMRGYGRPEAWGAAIDVEAREGSADLVDAPADPVALSVVQVVLAAEERGEATLLAYVEPSVEATELSGVLLPSPGSDASWSLRSVSHEPPLATGEWVLVRSRLAATIVPHDIPVVVHRAIAARVVGGAVVEAHLYVDPLELGPVSMDFVVQRAGKGLAENATGGKVYGPSRPWCCHQRPDAEDPECWMLDPASAGHCRRAGWKEYACRHRHGCVGENCFCCESELDAACEPEPEPPPPRQRPPRSRRPSQGTIWSPY